MMSRQLLVLFFIFSATAFGAGNVSQRRQEVIKIINQELAEVQRLSKQFDNKNGDLLFRQAELTLEKGRIIKEIENEKYLAMSVEQRQKTTKRNHFSGSFGEFQKARNIAQGLLKNNKNYERSADVYYILGFNEKEFGNEKQALIYFEQAEKFAKNGSESQMRIENALAEMYYNDKKYDKSIYYYERNLKHVKDRWWTKDAYNLSWSYYRIKKYESAIDLMKKVSDLSKNKKYVDMSGNATKDLGLFYSESGQIKEGVKYFKSINQDFSLELVTLGLFLKEQGKFPQALTTLNQALENTNNPENRVKVLLARIDIYDRVDNFDAHLKDTKELMKEANYKILTPEQKTLLTFQSQKQVAKLQKRLTEKTYSTTANLREKQAAYVATYIDLLKQLDPKTVAKNTFYKAETYYQAQQYDLALKNYIIAYDESERSKDQKLLKLSAEGLIATLGAIDQGGEVRSEDLIDGYKRYLRVDPSSKKAQEVYKRMYKFYLDKSYVSGMRNTLALFVTHNKGAAFDQEKMLNSLVQLVSKKNDDATLAQIMGEVKAGKYNISPKGREDLAEVFNKIEIKNIETKLASGDYTGAYDSYIKVYENKSSNNLVRSSASYNLMVISYKNHDLKNTYDWGIKSLAILSVEDLAKYRDSYLEVSKYLFERMQFNASADIAHRALGKMCTLKNPLKGAFYKNALLGYTSAYNFERIDGLVALVKSCQLGDELNSFTKLTLLDSYYERKNFSRLENLLESFWNDKFFISEKISYASLAKNFNETSGNFARSQWWDQKIWALYTANANTKLSQEALDAVSKAKSTKLNTLYSQLKMISLTFPEDAYNKALQAKFKKLEEIQIEAADVQKIGGGYGIVFSFQVVIAAYDHIVSQVSQFTPPGKSPEYVTSFKESMGKIVAPLAQKKAELNAQVAQLIEKNQILTTSNPQYLPANGNIFEDFKVFEYHKLGGR
jgi:tetratricopeptide (TPR) repeat protein